MDRLVRPDVKEVELAFEKGQKCSTTFRLTNLMHTMSVAVCLTTSNPSIFSFAQPFSIIPPLSSSSYTIICKPSDQPILSTPPSIITVRSSMLPIGKANLNDLKRIFSKPGRHVFRDATILISFVGSQVVEYLISQHTRVPELSFFLNKAISGCTQSQLSGLLKAAISSGKTNLVSTLIDAGADVNLKDSNRRSMLSAAVRAGNSEVVKRLIDSGCAVDNLVDWVLHYTAAMNRTDLMEILCMNLRNISVNSVDSDGRTPMHIAAACGHIEAIRFCVSSGGSPNAMDSNKWSPLHCAAAEGQLDAVNYLLDCSTAKYAVNNDGKTAFALAAENGHSHLFDPLHLSDALHRAARLGDVNGLKSSLVEGAKVNGKDQNGWTALHRAAFKGRIECVKMLLEYGAEVDVVDESGYTPTQYAVEAEHKQVAMMLVAYGAKANLKNLQGLNALSLDCFKNHPSLVAPPVCHDKERA